MLASIDTPSVLTQQPSLTDIVDPIIAVVASISNTRLAVLDCIDGSNATILAVRDRLSEVRLGGRFALADSFCLQVLPDRQPLIVPNIDLAAPAIRRIPAALELDIKSYLGVPIILASGATFGTLWVADHQPREFTPQDVQALATMARLVCYEIDAGAAQRKTERRRALADTQPTLDPQTGLPGKEAFQYQLTAEDQRRQRYGGEYTVALIQIANLSDVLATSGSQAGDTLLSGLADVLMRTSRIVDFCARIDHNMFAVLFLHTTANEIAPWRTRLEGAVANWNLMYSARSPHLVINISVAESSEATATEIVEFATHRLGSDPAEQPATS